MRTAKEKLYSHRNMSCFSEKEKSMNLISRKRVIPLFFLSIILVRRALGTIHLRRFHRSRPNSEDSWPIQKLFADAIVSAVLGKFTGRSRARSSLNVFIAWEAVLWFAALDPRNTMVLLSLSHTYFDICLKCKTKFYELFQYNYIR